MNLGEHLALLVLSENLYRVEVNMEYITQILIVIEVIALITMADITIGMILYDAIKDRIKKHDKH